MQRRLTIVTRNALGDRTSTSDACRQRMNASWSVSSASATLPSMRYAIENSRPRCRSKAASLARATLTVLVSIEPVEVHIRGDQCSQEQQRVDDEEKRIADRKMSNAGRDQGDGKTEVCELSCFEWDARYQKREDAQRFGHRQFYPEIVGKSQMRECALHRTYRVLEIEVDGAEHHHSTHNARGNPVDGFIFCHCRSSRGVPILLARSCTNDRIRRWPVTSIRCAKALLPT